MSLAPQFVLQFFCRLAARHHLRAAGYCPKHLIKKQGLSEIVRGNLVRVFAGEFDPPPEFESGCSAMDMADHYRTYCELCREEKSRQEQQRLDQALSVLGGKLK